MDMQDAMSCSGALGAARWRELLIMRNQLESAMVASRDKHSVNIVSMGRKKDWPVLKRRSEEEVIVTRESSIGLP